MDRDLIASIAGRTLQNSPAGERAPAHKHPRLLGGSERYPTSIDVHGSYSMSNISDQRAVTQLNPEPPRAEAGAAEPVRPLCGLQGPPGRRSGEDGLHPALRPCISVFW